MGRVHVGTCSWADRTMIEAWYPPDVSTPAARLRHYAKRFDTVEADAPFYAIPDRRVVENWTRRTPEGFVFHVKAFGMMTQHAVDERALHPELREYPHEVERGRVKRPSQEMVDLAFDLFCDSIEPLEREGKLGGVLMQFPPFFTALDDAVLEDNLAYIDYARGRLGKRRMLVEFRHPSWVSPERVRDTLRFLSDRDITYVGVDAPQFPTHTTMPPLVAATSRVGYVRLHGRNRDTYFARNVSAADRFDYLYGHDELEEWVPRVRELAEQTDVTYVMFNNCKYDYAPRNARELADILGPELVKPVTGEHEQQLDLDI
ncbi:MAG TPA: DUF72 domain-containing protein [Coriobacteriia bacterium]|nr:MAG: hypothetical protein XD74_0539 [Actinobacteria bacterium 66_15]HAL29811.1 DUF72 domain-containing protein [Coriobacteriia bacterium]